MVDKTRWITTVFQNGKRYHVRAIDIEGPAPHNFFVEPDHKIEPSTYVTDPGKYVEKKNLPPSIKQTIANHLGQIEDENGGQIVMKI